MTSAPPADQYYLYVLALSRSVTLAQLIDALAERLGPLQVVELVTAAPPPAVIPPPPWWHSLTQGDRVRPARDGVVVAWESGQTWRRIATAAGVVWDVYGAPDIARARVCVYRDAGTFAAGLWVSADDIATI